ncbi:hypothetical protein EIN_085130 [Entamoeba invadens IP1]|uniref:hypothetical protein n=1 Tax=Entamoeba invadens IP1 TaxID=370355 RepID=UPI0002C3DB28|nr:hypothetical protein EIN_085130 [Entamoeba invadens IP1]ELP85301.1 hypothetical protein EIN_085130 [Entamoeba invadens IP1]|eukprot:XP_004184647.1 hypothetical protein EIN_085130 [Entamoeba invadens IP1]
MEEAGELWQNTVISQVEVMSIIPHYTFDKMDITQDPVLLIESGPDIRGFNTELIPFRNFAMVSYDHSFEISTQKAANPQDVEAFIKATRKAEENPLSLIEILERFNQFGYNNKHIIHIAPSLDVLQQTADPERLRNVFENFLISQLNYSLVVLSLKNTQIGRLLSDLRKNQVFDRCDFTHPFSVITFPRITPYDIFPYQRTIKGIFVKIPENYAMDFEALEFNYRPPFYVITPATLSLEQNFLVGKHKLITRCSSPQFECDGPLVMKEQRFLHNKLLFGALDLLEAQTVAKEICRKMPNKAFSVLEGRVFIETDEHIESGTTMGIEKLMELHITRVGVVERYVTNLKNDTSEQFKALQHWSYFYTAKRVLIEALMSSDDSENKLHFDREKNTLTATCLKVCHESITKYFFTNTNNSTPGMKNFVGLHRCNEDCKCFSL